MAIDRLGYRQATAWLVWLFILGNGTGSVALWVDAGGAGDFGTWGVGLRSSGRVTGMLGAYLALVQVLLLARLPWLNWLAGFDRLTVWHRRSGKAALYIVVAHVVFTTVGYSLSDRISIPADVQPLLTTTYPGMVTATIGSVLFIVVAASSYTIARRRLRHEVWYLIDFTATRRSRSPGSTRCRRAPGSPGCTSPATPGSRSTSPRWRCSSSSTCSCRCCRRWATGCGSPQSSRRPRASSR